MNKILTVGDYIDIRNKTFYGRKIRVLDAITHENLGRWYDKKIINRPVKTAKITEKYLFIFI